MNGLVRGNDVGTVFERCFIKALCVVDSRFSPARTLLGPMGGGVIIRTNFGWDFIFGFRSSLQDFNRAAQRTLRLSGPENRGQNRIERLLCVSVKKKERV